MTGNECFDAMLTKGEELLVKCEENV